RVGCLGFDTTSAPEAAPSEYGTFRLTAGVSRASARLRVTTVETQAPDSALAEDLAVSLGEEIDVETLTFETVLSYNWRFLELSAQAGFANTESGFDLRLSGELPEDSLAPGPFDIGLESSESQSGFLYGVGGAFYVPLGPLVFRGGSTVSFRRFDTLNSTAFTGTAGLVRRQPIGGVPIDFSLGTAYAWISRRSEFSRSIVGDPITVRIEQELRDPWSLVAAVGLPLGDSARLLLATTQSFTGTSGYSVRLAF
ncbi:MAG: hypothetical protein AAFX94_22975, partial [Myxococcota bacterium]